MVIITRVLLIVTAFLMSAAATAEAQSCQTANLLYATPMAGTITSADCIVPQRNSAGEYYDFFAFRGEKLVITMDRGTMVDPYLYLVLRESDFVVAENDNFENGSNARIEVIAPVTGAYRAIATSAIVPLDQGSFVIRLTADFPACQIRTALSNTTYLGTIDESDCIVRRHWPRNVGEFWYLQAAAGDSITITMNRVTLDDPLLVLLDANNKPLVFEDNGGGNGNARIEFTATYTGQYRILAASGSFSSDVGTYEFRFDVAGPPRLPGRPGQPAARVTNTQVEIEWTAPDAGSGPILEYILEAGTLPGGSNLGVFSMGTATQIVAFVSSGTYYIRVRARNTLGIGPPSLDATFSVGTPLIEPPRALTVNVIGRDATLAWISPLDGPPDSYRLEAGSMAGATNIASIDLAGNLTTLVAVNIPPGIYYVRLRAIRGDSVSNPSNEVAVLVF